MSWDALRGKVVILEFWTTWCAGCLPAMEHLHGVAEKLAGRPVQVVAITDEGDRVVTWFLGRHPAPRLWIGLDADRATFDAFGVGPVPCTFIVGPTGRIVAITHPQNVTPEAVEAALAGKDLDLPVVEPGYPPIPAGEEAGPRAVLRQAPPGRGEFTQSFAQGWVSWTGRPSDLLESAFQVSPALIELETELPRGLFTADVRMPEGRESDLLPTVQRTILSSLNLTATWKEKEEEVLVLRTVPGPNELRPSQSRMGKVQGGAASIDATAFEISKLVDKLGDWTGLPVIDETGLEARYDYFLGWDPQKPETLDSGLAKLGLKTVREKRRVKVLVVRTAGEG